jgi:hypothetical protein
MMKLLDSLVTEGKLPPGYSLIFWEGLGAWKQYPRLRMGKPNRTGQVRVVQSP